MSVYPPAIKPHEFFVSVTRIAMLLNYICEKDRSLAVTGSASMYIDAPFVGFYLHAFLDAESLIESFGPRDKFTSPPFSLNTYSIFSTSARSFFSYLAMSPSVYTLRDDGDENMQVNIKLKKWEREKHWYTCTYTHAHVICADVWK